MAATSYVAFEDALTLLGAKDRAGKAMCACPTHGSGKNQALRVWRKPDGGTSVKCFGGCRWEDIHSWLCAQLGIRPTEAKPRAVDAAELKRRDDARREAEATAARKRERAVTRTATVMKVASHVVSHPYLMRKGVQPTPTLRVIPLLKLLRAIQYHPKDRDGEKLLGDILVVPVKVGDTFTSMEFIDGDGRKSALAGGEKAGGFWLTERLPENPEVILVGEGVATVLSASQCSGYPGVACLSVSGLEAVVKLMKARFPASKIVVLADLNDKGLPHETAVQVAKEQTVFLGLPSTKGDCRLLKLDFNDAHLINGSQSVQSAIQKALEQTTR
jgi:putative DNA primase/helicase